MKNFTLKEFIENNPNEDVDIDVYSNYDDTLCIAYCGTQLTHKGYKRYGDILHLIIEIDDDNNACVLINNDEENDKVVEMFYYMAGYCSSKIYDDFFYIPDEYGLSENNHFKYENLDEQEMYVCVKDSQGGNFAVGYVNNEKDWCGQAIEWLRMDDNEEMITSLLNSENIIDFIMEYWQIIIVPIEQAKEFL